MKTDAIRECVGLVADAAGRDGPAVAAESELEAIARSDPQTLVTEFHRKMGLPVASEPTVGTAEQRCLRVRLMLEEVLEFAKAACVVVHSESGDEILSARDLNIGYMDLFTPDLAQMTHELADVQYVVSGTAVELSLPVRESLPLIHAANMRKEPVLDSGGKVRKPDGWVPADVSGLVRR